MITASPHVVIFHGTKGSPEGNWIPWLREEMAQRNVRTSVPRFPTPENQSLSSWLHAFREQVGEPSPEMIFIGHSMGCGMMMRLLEVSACAITASFFVSGFTGAIGIAEYDALNASFFEDPIDWNTVCLRAGRVFCYHGDDDPYVLLPTGQEFAHKLHADLKVISGGGHLNEEAGYVRFGELMTDLVGVLQGSRHPVS